LRGIRRALYGLAFGLAAAALAYVLLRLVESVFFPEPNPVVVIWTDRSRFGWRAMLAGYLGGAAVFGGHALAGRDAEAASLWLFRLVILGAVSLFLQGVFVP